MAWGNRTETYHLRSCEDVGEADAYYETLTPKRGDDVTRWLRHKNRQQWAYKYNNGDIGFFLYGRELVRFNSDGTLDITVWGKGESESAFVNALVPTSVQADFISFNKAGLIGTDVLDPVGNRIVRWWRLASTMRLRPAHAAYWEPISGTEPFTTPLLDRRAASEALKRSGASDFFAYAQGRLALGLFSPSGSNYEWVDLYGPQAPRPDPSFVSGRDAILAMLADQSQWDMLLTHPSMAKYSQDGRRAVLNVIENVRRAVYFSSPNIFHKDVQPYLDGSNALKYWHTTNRKYLYANLE